MLGVNLNWRRIPFVGTLLPLLFSVVLTAQTAQISAYHDPADLVRAVIKNETKASSQDSSHFLFRGTKTTPKESVTRLYVETKDATAGLAIAYNGRPLDAQQRQAENDRLHRLITHPDELKKKAEKEQADADHSLRILRALPDAFLYEYAGRQAAGSGQAVDGASLVKLNFRPNPHYAPPSRVEEVLTGMQGFLLVDPVHARLATIDGTLFKEVNFGWGILGHLNRGSRFVVDQKEVGSGSWQLSSMTLNITGKIMLVKSLAIASEESYSDFKPVPADLTFAQGVSLLKTEETSFAVAQSGAASPAK